MLFTVMGASGHRRVVGLRSDDRQGLLALGVPTTVPILLLTPRHHTVAAREQAHVLLAADPAARVCVLPLDHHALTLVLIADALQSSAAAAAGWPDPSEAVRLACRHAAHSHSMVWYRSVWGLEEPVPTAGQLAAGLLRRTGFVRELAATPALVPARPGSPVAAGATVHHVVGAPAAMSTQLGAVTLLPVEVVVEPARYATRSSTELTLLVAADTRISGDGGCGSCGAGLIAGQCPFCGHGPWRSGSAPAARTPVTTPVPVPASGPGPDLSGPGPDLSGPTHAAAPDAVTPSPPSPALPVGVGAGGSHISGSDRS